MFRLGLLFSLLAGLLGAAPSGGARPPPNLIVILADDLGYGDLGCYGSTQHLTPNIDRLAREGARFTDFYVTSSVCTPARVGLLTGRHPLRVGFSTLLWPDTPGGLPATENTLPELLRDRGYTSGLAGKWHLGHSDPAFLPLAHGFDSFYGMPYPNDMMPGHIAEVLQRGHWPLMPMMEGNKIIESGIDVNVLTQQYTAEAVRFIARHHHGPFFLFLSHAMPHSVVGASPDFRGQSGNGLYGDAVQELDWSTGEIMRTLRAFGLEENTLIVFSSDNGAVMREHYNGRAEFHRQMFPDLHMGSNGPLRGGKQTTFEGGVRVPTLMRWPGVIAPDSTITDAAWIADILPTFLDFLDLKLPEDRAYDGTTLRPLLTGSGHRQGDEFAFGRDEVTALRQGDWKLVLPIQPQFVPLPTSTPMLFNLALDPGETNDLAASDPAQLEKLLTRLRAIAAEFAADTVSRPTP